MIKDLIYSSREKMREGEIKKDIYIYIYIYIYSSRERERKKERKRERERERKRERVYEKKTRQSIFSYGKGVQRL